MFYKIKVLFAALYLYCADKTVSTAGAVEQAKTLVNEVEKQCRK
jgi:hypothetical protein